VFGCVKLSGSSTELGSGRGVGVLVNRIDRAWAELVPLIQFENRKLWWSMIWINPVFRNG
jgi:hypothetical protein